jgi:hypothetical protein
MCKLDTTEYMNGYACAVCVSANIWDRGRERESGNETGMESKIPKTGRLLAYWIGCCT